MWIYLQSHIATLKQSGWWARTVSLIGFGKPYICLVASFVSSARSWTYCVPSFAVQLPKYVDVFKKKSINWLQFPELIENDGKHNTSRRCLTLVHLAPACTRLHALARTHPCTNERILHRTNPAPNHPPYIPTSTQGRLLRDELRITNALHRGRIIKAMRILILRIGRGLWQIFKRCRGEMGIYKRIREFRYQWVIMRAWGFRFWI